MKKMLLSCAFVIITLSGISQTLQTDVIGDKILFKTNNATLGGFTPSYPTFYVNGEIHNSKEISVTGLNPRLNLIGNEGSYYPGIYMKVLGLGVYSHYIMPYGQVSQMYYTVGDHWFQTGTNGTVMNITSTGNVGIGTGDQSPVTSKLEINGGANFFQLRLTQPKPFGYVLDANTGKVGDICWDDSNIYIKTNNGWKKVALQPL